MTVVTALPNYPRGEFYEGYRGRFFMQEDWNGIRVVRTWLFPTKSKKVISRLLNYFSFLPGATLAGLWLARKGDIVLVNSPPLFLGLVGVLVTRMRGAKLVLNVADLWPASGAALGIVANRRILRWATAFEEYLYRHCALITGQTRGIVKDIQRRCPEVPVRLLTNGVAPEFLAQMNEARAARMHIREEFAWDGKFVVGFAGLHGLAYDLDLVLQTCGMLRDSPEVKFALFGDGPQKPHLQRRAAQMGLRNVEFYPLQPASRIPQILAAIDAAVIPLKQGELFKGTLPARLFEAMGAAVPVIAAVEGEAQELMEKSQCGIRIELGDAMQLVGAIRALENDSDLREAMGENGRRYVLEHFNREEVARKFEKLVEELQSTLPAQPLPGMTAPPD